MFIKEKKASELAELLNPFDYVILDTCSLMDENFPEWMDVLIDAKNYRKKGQQIVVFKTCIDELKKHLKNKKRDSKRIAAKRALKIVRHAKWRKLLTVSKIKESQNFADNVIFVKVSADRIYSRVAVITQDKKLAYDLVNLNNLASQRGYKVFVYKIAPGGILENNKGAPAIKENHSKPIEKDNLKEKKEKAFPFALVKVMETDSKLKDALTSPTYPVEKKIADIKTQLANLNRLDESDRKKLTLAYDASKLNALLRQYSIKIKPKEATPVVKKEENKPIVASPIESKQKLYYGNGRTIEDALNDVSTHYGLLYRDPTVPYFPLIHGKADLTIPDYRNMVEKIDLVLKKSNKSSFFYSSFEVICEKVSNGYHVYMDFDAKDPKANKKEVKKAEPIAKKEPITKKKENVTKPKVEKPLPKVEVKKDDVKKAESKPASSKKTSKSSKKAKAIENKPVVLKKEEKPESVQVVVPNGATLLVGEPSKDKSKKEEPNKQKETKKEARPKKQEPKKAKTPVKEAKKPVSKPKTSRKVPVDEILAFDKRLKAVLSNPNYPKEDKIKDIKKQHEDIKLLSSEDKKKLLLSARKLNSLLSELDKK